MDASRGKAIDKGTRFGMLVVTELAGSWGGGLHWRCLCDCGIESTPLGTCLRNGSARSCGCRMKNAGKHNATHGLLRSGRKHYLWHTYSGIKQRTGNPNHIAWDRYGGRGIRLAPQWQTDFLAFVTWIEENLGRRPLGHTLDRIDNDSGYRPGNLRWATQAEQLENRTDTVKITQLTRERDDLAVLVLELLGHG